MTSRVATGTGSAIRSALRPATRRVENTDLVESATLPPIPHEESSNTERLSEAAIPQTGTLPAPEPNSESQTGSQTDRSEAMGLNEGEDVAPSVVRRSNAEAVALGLVCLLALSWGVWRAAVGDAGGAMVMLLPWTSQETL